MYCWVKSVPLLCVIAVLLQSCSSKVYVPVVDVGQPPTEKILTHRVSRGETLYSIAWRYNLDPEQLAVWNNVRSPQSLGDGQQLKLFQPEHTTFGRREQQSKKRLRPTVITKAAVKQDTTRKRSNQHASVKKIRWRYPSAGKLGRGFEVARKEGWKQKLAHHGQDFLGATGDAIKASAAGEVVYAGDGLASLGRLVIIKHNKQYLSAYAHNNRLLVKEGQQVQAGQKIAEMGSTGTTFTNLHFEVRYKGTPIDPLTVLEIN